ncbi:ATP-binding protein [Belliella kenyensis]|uniref:histidine kinase n=1 Tax=Belliella kenyensis TaxID=1472724 RepID=A0ABV8EH88_9BACT|nr:ATP-binding protein [Belliella kenyensis]MCH7403462.1 ATP-binding protein [Belliella kenyensis]MDN3602362.1 ATP-binding protein [Belliella kenyensis]
MKSHFLILLFILLNFDLLGQSFQFNSEIKGVALPTSNVKQLTQDREGLIWFNTNDGIYYSDGMATYGIPDSISNDLTNKVSFQKDDDGLIWVFNVIKEVKVYKNSKFGWEELKLPQELEDLNSLKFLNVTVLGKGQEKMVHVITLDAIWSWRVLDGKWHKEEFSSLEYGPFISGFFYHGESYLFFEKASFHLGFKGLERLSFQGVDIPGSILYVAYSEEDSVFYYLGRDFLAQGSDFLQIDKLAHVGFVKNIYSVVDYSGLQFKDGRVYYFFNSQLYKYNPENNQVQEISVLEALKAYNIYSAFVDREGIIWIGTNRGLVNINSLLFLNFDSRRFLEDEVTAVAKLGDGRFLFGFNNGVQLFENGVYKNLRHEIALAGQPRNRVTNFSKDKNGIFWFSSNLAGVGRYVPQTGELTYEESKEGKFVTSVKAIGDSLFVVTRDRVYLSDINRKSGFFENDITLELLKNIPKEQVFLRKVDKLKDGRLIFLQGGNELIQGTISQTDEYINVIGYDFLEENGKMLIGTESGLKVWEDGEITDFELRGQRIRRPIFVLLKDSRGKIWAGTDQGVYMIDDVSIRKFDQKSGLIGNEVNRGAMIETDRGRIMIGTQRGLSIYFPSEDDLRLAPPSTDILGISLLNKEIKDPDLTKVSYQNNSVEINYRAISFLQFTDLVVNYKLDGYHEDWQQIFNPTSNSLVFNNLPSGTYRLRMFSSLGGVIFSDEILSEPFTIRRPFYAQAWFVLIVLGIFVGIGFLLNTLVNQGKSQLMLKKTIDEKTKEAFTLENQFRNVWNSSVDGLILSLEGGRILTGNPSLEKMVGFSRSELESMHIKDLYTDPDFYYKQRDIILSNTGAGIQNKSIEHEAEMPFKSGKRIISMFITWLEAEYHGSRVLLTVFRDVTDKRQYEESLMKAKEKAEESNRLKSSFLSNMSHEIRTPLNGILGTAAHIAETWKQDQKLQEQLEVIKESGERLLHTINGILDLSKIEANKMDVLLENTEVNDYVRKVLLPLKTLAMKKGLLLSAKFETKPFMAKIDRRYLEMIINNLVGNAIKYSEKGLICVKVGLHDGNLKLEIQDEGVGIGQDFMDKLFNPFEQESEGYNRMYEGTGLGLTITKSLIEILKGKISLKSEKGKGTLATVELPLFQN